MTLDEYQAAAQRTAIYPDQGDFGGLIYTTLKLNGEAGEIAEKIGKIIRDGGSSFHEHDRIALCEELGDVLWYVAMLARELNVDLDFIADMNLAKLASRQTRGKLSGSGDSR